MKVFVLMENSTEHGSNSVIIDIYFDEGEANIEKEKLDKKSKKDGEDEYCFYSVSGYVVKGKNLSLTKEAIWTLERCKEVALKFSTKGEWSKSNGYSYNKARKNEWLDACTEHMEKKKIKWTLEKCKEDAMKYKTLAEWTRKSPAYITAYRNN